MSGSSACATTFLSKVKLVRGLDNLLTPTVRPATCLTSLHQTRLGRLAPWCKYKVLTLLFFFLKVGILS